MVRGAGDNGRVGKGTRWNAGEIRSRFFTVAGSVVVTIAGSVAVTIADSVAIDIEADDGTSRLPAQGDLIIVDDSGGET